MSPCPIAGSAARKDRPSEAGLIEDARAAYDFARAQHPDAKVVLWGESLGTGVAVAIAAEKDVAAVVLEAPYTSTADIAFATYPFIPVRLLMKDQFRSDERIGKVKAPLLMLHGAQDRIIPLSYGERLFALANEPKQFRSIRARRARKSRSARRPAGGARLSGETENLTRLRRTWWRGRCCRYRRTRARRSGIEQVAEYRCGAKQQIAAAARAA